MGHEFEVLLGHVVGKVGRPVRYVGLRLKVDIFPGDTYFGVSGSLIIITEALGRVRFSEKKS